MEREVWVREEGAEGLRIDRYIAEYLELCSRSQMRQRDFQVFLNGKEAKLSKTLHSQDHLLIRYGPPPATEIKAEKLPLDIVYEDKHCIVLNKAQGMVVHPAAGNYSGTLVQGLLHHIAGLEERFGGESSRPGIVHRLDKDTSGIIVAAKDPESLNFLARQFAKKKVEKRYLALVKGHLPKQQGVVDHPIARDPHNRKRFTWKRPDGKASVTEYRVLRRLRGACLVELRPKTGRTHQLRVHMASLGHPIVGDPIYGRPGGEFVQYSLMLHAASIRIRLPGTKDRREFRAPLPRHFKYALVELRA